MSKIVTIAIREFSETVKTKVFLFSLLIAPLLWAGMMSVASRMETVTRSAMQPERRLQVLDLTGELGGTLSEKVDRHNRERPGQRIRLQLLAAAAESSGAVISLGRASVAKRSADALLVIPTGSPQGGRAPQLHISSANIADYIFSENVESLLNQAIAQQRGARLRLAPADVETLTRKVGIERIDIDTSRKADMAQVRMMTPFVFMMFLFMGIMTTSGQMLTSVIEEKSSRVAEVLLSAVTPSQFMFGKVLGLSVVGLLVVLIWGGFAYAGALQRGLATLVTARLLTFFLIYFVLGFLLFSSIFAAIGSACSTIKEAQSLVLPVNLLNIVPLMGWFFFSANPDAFWTRLLSFVPTMTPMLMMLRICASRTLSMTEIALSIILLTASVAGALWASGKIFRTGILMYGKGATLREMLRWVRCR